MPRKIEYFRTNDGVRLAYMVEGKGKNVLMLSGFGVPVETMENQAEYLRAEGCRTILLDRRGHGHSEKPAYGQRLARHAEDVRELICHLELEDLILVGHSMGAAVLFAYLSLFGQEHIRGIVDIDQTPKTLNSADWKYGAYGLDFQSLDEYLQSPQISPFYLGRGVPSLEKYVQRIKSYPVFERRDAIPLLQDHICSDWRDILPRLTAPILFLTGKNSPYWPSAFAQESARLCPRGEAAVIEECGHCVPWEQEDRCREVLSDFIRKI